PSLLGIQGGIFQCQRRPDPRGRERLSERAVSGAAQLGGEGVRAPDLLPRGREGRPLRGLGTTATLLGRAPSRVPLATLIRKGGRWTARVSTVHSGMTDSVRARTITTAGALSAKEEVPM